MFIYPAPAARRARRQWPFQSNQWPLQQPFINFPLQYQPVTPLPLLAPQPPRHAPQPQPVPSQTGSVVKAILQLCGVVAEGYVRLVVLPEMKAEVRAELKEAARKNRLGDVACLLLADYGLNKLSNS
jgi:hypothetical protein